MSRTSIVKMVLPALGVSVEGSTSIEVGGGSGATPYFHSKYNFTSEGRWVSQFSRVRKTQCFHVCLLRRQRLEYLREQG